MLSGGLNGFSRSASSPSTITTAGMNSAHVATISRGESVLPKAIVAINISERVIGRGKRKPPGDQMVEKFHRAVPRFLKSTAPGLRRSGPPLN